MSEQTEALNIHHCFIYNTCSVIGDQKFSRVQFSHTCFSQAIMFIVKLCRLFSRFSRKTDTECEPVSVAYWLACRVWASECGILAWMQSVSQWVWHIGLHAEWRFTWHIGLHAECERQWVWHIGLHAEWRFTRHIGLHAECEPVSVAYLLVCWVAVYTAYWLACRVVVYTAYWLACRVWASECGILACMQSGGLHGIHGWREEASSTAVWSAQRWHYSLSELCALWSAERPGKPSNTCHWSVALSDYHMFALSMIIDHQTCSWHPLWFVWFYW